MQRFALYSIRAGNDDQIPDADETLLEFLTEAVRAGEWLTPSELLRRAQERDQNTFGKWGPRAVSNRLKPYGIEARKINNRREFRDTTLRDLERIQRHYGIDLGIVESAPFEDSSSSSRIVPEGQASSQESLV